MEIVRKCKPGHHMWEIGKVYRGGQGIGGIRLCCEKCGSWKDFRDLEPDPDPAKYPPGTYEWID